MPATQLALSLVGLVRCFFRSNNTEQVQEKYGNGYGYGYGRKNHISSTGTERVRVLSKKLVRKKERVRVILRSGEYVTGTGFFELKLRYGYGYGYGRISILEVRVRIPYPYPYSGVWCRGTPWPKSYYSYYPNRFSRKCKVNGCVFEVTTHFYPYYPC